MLIRPVLTEMYQFWMNVMDADAVRFLKIFTLLPLDEIEEIGNNLKQLHMNVLAQNLGARSRYTRAWRKAYKEALNITGQLLPEYQKSFCQRAETRGFAASQIIK